jgi:hypothetical protein
MGWQASLRVACQKPETAQSSAIASRRKLTIFDEHSKACLLEAGKHFGRKSRMMSRSIRHQGKAIAALAQPL